MLVLRVENQNKCGPYRGSYIGTEAARVQYNVEDCNTYQSYHPNPRTDPLLAPWFNSAREYSDYRNYIYGFKDIRSLIRWFPKKNWKWFRNSNIDWYISLYGTDDFVIGQRQVVFRNVTSEFLGHIIKI